MPVTIRIQRNVQFLTNNQDSIEVKGSTVGQCLAELAARFPELRRQLAGGDKRLLDFLQVFVNGESAYPNEESRPVADGDVIDVMFLISGG